jgi:hypothetical protein
MTEYIIFDGYCECSNRITATLLQGDSWGFNCPKCGKRFEGDDETNPLDSIAVAKKVDIALKSSGGMVKE